MGRGRGGRVLLSVRAQKAAGWKTRPPFCGFIRGTQWSNRWPRRRRGFGIGGFCVRLACSLEIKDRGRGSPRENSSRTGISRWEGGFWEFPEPPFSRPGLPLKIRIAFQGLPVHSSVNPLSGGGSPAGASVRGSRKRPPYSLGNSTVP